MSTDELNSASAGTETLPASTPEYAPAVQTIVENVPEGETHTVAVETSPIMPLPDSSPYLAPREPESQETPSTPELPDTPSMPSTPVPPVAPAHPPTTTAAQPSAVTTAITPPTPVTAVVGVTPITPPASTSSPEKRVYDLLLEEFSRDPRFELHTNVRALLQEVQAMKAMPPTANASAAVMDDLAFVRETVVKIWTHLEKESVGAQFIAPSAVNTPNTDYPIPTTQYPTPELIAETRALVRSVNEEINATRNSVIQLTNQGRMMLDVATRCLREMDKTAQQYEKQGETNPLLDELHSLRDMLADGFENARLEPIVPEPGETFRYSDHRADNGSASSGKIKRTVLPGFRWTQPNPPVVLMPAVVETE